MAVGCKRKQLLKPNQENDKMNCFSINTEDKRTNGARRIETSVGDVEKITMWS